MKIDKESMIKNINDEILHLTRIIVDMEMYRDSLDSECTDFTDAEKDIILNTIVDNKDDRFIFSYKENGYISIYFTSVNFFAYCKNIKTNKTLINKNSNKNKPVIKLNLENVDSIFKLNKLQKNSILMDFEEGNPNFNFIESFSGKHEFPKIDSDDNIFVININVDNKSNIQAKNYCRDIMELYFNKYNKHNEYEFIFIPIQNEPSAVICLTNSDKEVGLLF